VFDSVHQISFDQHHRNPYIKTMYVFDSVLYIMWYNAVFVVVAYLCEERVLLA